jgi:hypothetical protein
MARRRLSPLEPSRFVAIDAPSARLHQLNYLLELACDAHRADALHREMVGQFVRSRILWPMLMEPILGYWPHEQDPDTLLESGAVSPEAAILLARMSETLHARVLWELSAASAPDDSSRLRHFRRLLGQRLDHWLAQLPEERAAPWREHLQRLDKG